MQLARRGWAWARSSGEAGCENGGCAQCGLDVITVEVEILVVVSSGFVQCGRCCAVNDGGAARCWVEGR